MATSLSYRQLEQRTAARALARPVTAHLSLACDLANRTGGKQRARLSAAVSEIAGLAAWLHADLTEPAQARRYYKMSVAAAQQAQYPLLAIYMQGSFGQYATTVGDAVHGLRLIRDATGRLPRSAPPTARAWLASLEAVSLGYLGDRAALKVLDDAERYTEASVSGDPVWPWVFQLDASSVASYRAVATSRLGLAKMATAAFDIADGSARSPSRPPSSPPSTPGPWPPTATWTRPAPWPWPPTTSGAATTPSASARPSVTSAPASARGQRDRSPPNSTSGCTAPTPAGTADAHRDHRAPRAAARDRAPGRSGHP
jgi:hypothetical protein